MRSVGVIVIFGAAMVTSTAVLAGDEMIYAPRSSPQYYDPGARDPGARELQVQDPDAHDPGGWYLRGDIGFSNQRVNNLYNVDYENVGPVHVQQTTAFDTAGIIGGGVGYVINSWLRADVTGQYRGNANFKGMDRFTYNAGGPGYAINTYVASQSAMLFMANVYVDLGTWNNITPFVGAGVGASRVTVRNLIDTSLTLDPANGPTAGSAISDPASKWNLAWSLQGGLAYRISSGMTIEMAYRYLSLGDGLSGDLATYTNTNTHYNPMEFKNITSQDVTLGLRWSLDPPVVYVPPVIVRKG